MPSSASRVHVRPYRTADAEPTLGLFLAAITQTAAADYTPEQVVAWAAEDERDVSTWDEQLRSRDTVVALVDGTVAGFSDVDADGFVTMMFVSPAFQRRGVAHALLAEVEMRARRHSARTLTADVSVTARPFFEAHDFVVEREQRPVRRGVELVNFRMTRPLDRT